MITGKYLTSRDDISSVLDIRRAVFGKDLPEWAKRDELDDMSIYAIAMSHGVPAGCGRLSIVDDRFTISRVCVLESRRGEGLGDMIARMLLMRAIDLGAGEVFVAPRQEAKSFYRKYGFEDARDGLMRATPESISRLAGGCGACL
ncbi:MAG: GNAT family N-acetyltransferase [Clostridia bacterium]|nr:GNAT family N-acetyltransferase [Clostridia bacterium]